MLTEASAAKQLNPDERDSLRDFCRLCEEISACRFAREYRQRTVPTLIGKRRDGTILDQYPRYDPEDVKSFLTSFRHLRAQEQPYLNLNRIINLLRKIGSDSDREMLTGYKAEVKAWADSWFGVKVKLDDEPDERFVTAVEIEDAWFNAVVFHRDPEKRQIWSKIERFGTFWEQSFLSYAMAVVHYACKVADFIREHGLLDEPREPYSVDATSGI